MSKIAKLMAALYAIGGQWEINNMRPIVPNVCQGCGKSIAHGKQYCEKCDNWCARCGAFHESTAPHIDEIGTKL